MEVGEHRIEGPGLSAAGIAGPAQHLQLREAGLIGRQDLGGPVLTAVVNDPDGQAVRRIAQGRQTLDQATNHGLFVTGRHHQINGGPTLELRRALRLGPAERGKKNGPQDVQAQQERQGRGRPKGLGRRQPMGGCCSPAATDQKQGGLQSARSCGCAPSGHGDPKDDWTLRAPLRCP